MINYLSKRVEQLLDTLLDPLWQRALRAPWSIRLTLLSLAAALIGWLTYPEKARSIVDDAYYMARGAFDDSGAPPLSARTTAKLRSTTNRLALLVKSDLTQLNAATPWSIAQTMNAILDQAGADRQGLAAFIRSGADPACSCWVEIPRTTTDRVVFISGWILAALAKAGIAASDDEVEFLLREQQDTGWWPTFAAAREPQAASTYATAWILIGLYEQKSRGLIVQQRLPDVERAIQNGTTWLLSDRQPKGRWKPYPHMPGSAVSEAVSGVVMHALHLTAPGEMIALDKEWLDNLPGRVIAVTDHEKSYVEVATSRGVSIDHFVQITLPWMLIATVDAFPSGDRMQRARATEWLEKQLNHEGVLNAETVGRNWWRAEVLYALRQTLRAVEG